MVIFVLVIYVVMCECSAVSVSMDGQHRFIRVHRFSLLDLVGVLLKGVCAECNISYLTLLE